MHFAELIGYAAAIVTIATFMMKTMIPLRIFGIAANFLFIAYGYLDAAYPPLVLHLILLPLNIARLYQMTHLVNQVAAASRADLDLGWLKPFMSARAVTRGAVLFRKSDPADEMFYVVTGRYRLVESGIAIAPGAIVGELGLLAPGHRRTQTFQCIEAGELLRITYDQVRQLYFQNPKFGFYFLQLTTRRLFENLARLEDELASRPPPEAIA